MIPKNHHASFDEDSDVFDSEEEERRPGRPSSKFSSSKSNARFSDSEDDESESVDLSAELDPNEYGETLQNSSDDNGMLSIVRFLLNFQ